MELNKGDAIEFERKGMLLRCRVLRVYEGIVYLNIIATADAVKKQWRNMGVATETPMPKEQIQNMKYIEN